LEVKTEKVLRRIAELGATEESLAKLEQVARDVGFALANGQREALQEVARELAAHAPYPPGGRDDKLRKSYWAGFSAALGTLLASYEAAYERDDAHAAALRAVRSDLSKAVVRLLSEAPRTGAELAAKLAATAGATSKILASLRGVGLVRVVGGQPYPKRGAAKPHILTPLGSWVARELNRQHDDDQPQIDVVN
jgi:hypothetical protein